MVRQTISNVSYIGTTPIVTSTPYNIALVDVPIEGETLQAGAGAGIRLLVWDTGNNLRHEMIMPPAYVAAFLQRMAGG